MKKPKIQLQVVFDLITCGDTYGSVLDASMSAIIMQTMNAHQEPYRYLFHDGGKDTFLAIQKATLVMSHSILQEVECEPYFGGQEELALHPLHKTRKVLQKLNGNSVLFF